MPDTSFRDINYYESCLHLIRAISCKLFSLVGDLMTAGHQKASGIRNQTLLRKERRSPMKIKHYLLFALIIVSACLTATCGIIEPDPDSDYAAKARQIVDDLYVYDGTDEDRVNFYNVSEHFYAILEIMGITVSGDQISPDTVALPTDYIDLITTTISLEKVYKISSGSSSQLASTIYYTLDDIADYLNNSSDWQVEREEGLGPITADDLKGVMDYYISLYENNTTIERQYFAGYLIGAIAKNNPDVGTYVDQYAVDRLQLFLILTDAFDLPEGISFDSITVRSVPDAVHGAVELKTSGSKSYWGAGAAKMKVKPSNTRQKVIDILEDGIKTYTYMFSLSGSASIYCNTWYYTAIATRTCTWQENSSAVLAPLDCSGASGVGGLSVDFEEHTQEHIYLAPLVPPKTNTAGIATFEISCDRSCPPGREKERLAGQANVNGYVTARFTGTDTAINYTIFPARAVFNLTERVGDQIICHKN